MGAARPGKGTKDYRHTNERIKEEVCDILAETPQASCSEIQASVESGMVTLTGTVADARMKDLSGEGVGYAAGVTHVNNRLRVRPAPFSEGKRIRWPFFLMLAGLALAFAKAAKSQKSRNQ